MLSPRRSWWAAAITFGLLCSGTYASVVMGDLKATETRLAEEVTATARLMRTHAATTLENGRRTLEIGREAVLDLLAGRAKPDDVQKRLQDLVAANPAIGTIWAVDGAGRSLISNLDAQLGSGPPTTRAYFQAHREGLDGVYVGAKEIGTVLRRPRFTISLPVREPDGRLAGVVVSGVDAAHFETLYAAIRPQLGTSALLVREDGAELAGWPDDQELGFDVSHIKPQGSDAVSLTRVGDSVVAVEQVEGLPILVVARAPRGEALAAWRQRAWQSAVPVVVALIAFGFLVWLGLQAVAENERARLDLEVRVKQRTEQLGLLLGELNHRVKNNLQLVSSLVQAGLSSIKDPAVTAAMRDTAHRIASLAEVHRTLEAAPTAGVQANAYIESIVSRLAESFSRAEQTITVRVSAPRIELPTDHAVAIGIAVNELVTNAFKHAFRDRTRGEVHVSLVADAGQNVLTVADDGQGGAGGATGAQGSRILNAMVQRLGGNLTVESTPTGTIATLTFPGDGGAAR